MWAPNPDDTRDDDPACADCNDDAVTTMERIGRSGRRERVAVCRLCFEAWVGSDDPSDDGDAAYDAWKESA